MSKKWRSFFFCEAWKSQTSLTKFREKHSLIDQQNHELDFGTQFNLACHMEHANMGQDALQTYASLTKSKYSLPDVAKVRVNMGNIYFRDRKYVEAISMYRRGVDSINNDYKHVR